MADNYDYSLEERERQIQQLDKIKYKKKDKVRKLEKTRLVREGVIKGTLTLAELRALASRDYGNAVLSLYITFTAENVLRERKIFLSQFNSLKESELAQSRKFIDSLTREQRANLDRDLKEIASFLENYDPEDTKTLIIFKSDKILNEIIQLPVPAGNLFRIDLDPYIEPLETAIQRQKKVIVAVVEKYHSSFFTYHMGITSELHTIQMDIPEGTVGEGMPHHRQQHLNTYLHLHFKQAASYIYRTCRESGCTHIMLMGTDATVIAQFKSFIHESLKQKVIGEAALSRLHAKNDIIRAIENGIERHNEMQEKESLARLGQYQAQGQVASGLPQVIEAQNRFLIRKLFVDDSLAREGYVCKRHHFLSLEPGQCPFGGEELTAADNIVDELFELALLQKIDITPVKYHTALLKPYEGIAGVVFPT